MGREPPSSRQHRGVKSKRKPVTTSGVEHRAVDRTGAGELLGPLEVWRGHDCTAQGWDLMARVKLESELSISCEVQGCVRAACP